MIVHSGILIAPEGEIIVKIRSRLCKWQHCLLALDVAHDILSSLTTAAEASLRTVVIPGRCWLTLSHNELL